MDSFNGWYEKAVRYFQKTVFQIKNEIVYNITKVYKPKTILQVTELFLFCRHDVIVLFIRQKFCFICDSISTILIRVETKVLQFLNKFWFKETQAKHLKKPTPWWVWYLSWNNCHLKERGTLGCLTILCSTIQMDLVGRCFGLCSTNRT